MQTIPQPKSSPNNIMGRILDVYHRGGTDAVRALLRRNNISEEKSATILAQLQQNFPDLPIKGVMPKDSLRSCLNNIYVVRVFRSQEDIEWMYQSMKHEAHIALELTRDLMRVAFLEALAAIVKDEPVTLADDNPYKPYVVKLVEAIDLWKSQQA
jgi:hypothetical protein